MLDSKWKLKLTLSLKLASFWYQPWFLGPSSDCTEEQENNLNNKGRTVKKSDCKEVPLVKVKKTDPNLETENLCEVSHFDIKMNIGGQ